MKALQRAALLGVLAFTWIVGTSYPLLATQQPAAATRQALTPDQMAEFLLNARIISTKDAGKGVTRTRRATLSDGQITHDAQIQTVDISKFTFTPDGGLTELNFRDSYRFNIAGYQLARLLDLDNVPVSVERRVQRDQAAVTWWVDDVLMDEAGRLKAEAQKKVPTEWPSIRTVNQIQLLRVFDELIANNDRNLGNLLWTADGKMWMIDHTRAFRLNKEEKNNRLQY